MADVIDMTRLRTVTVRPDKTGRVAPITVRDGAVILTQPEPLPTVPQVARVITSRVSRIDPAFPVYGVPTTVSVRNNFAAAKTEIEELQSQKLDLAGGVMTGPIFFSDDQIFDGGSFP